MFTPSSPHLVLGFSPFNPIFTHDWLCETLYWANRYFATIDIVHPGSLAMRLLVASGTPRGRAERKSRQQSNRDLRSIVAALQTTGVQLDHGKPIILSEEMRHPWYQDLLGAVAAEYSKNSTFRGICRGVSAKALASRMKATDPNRSADLDVAVRYVIEETPAFTHCPQLVGYDTATLAYPGSWAVGECIQDNQTSLTHDPGSYYFNLRTLEGVNHV